MDEQSNELWDRFQRFKIWTNGSYRAVNKPLLILWAIGRCLQGQERMAEYSLVAEELTRLLRTFGPYRPSVNPHHPFWRLRNDRIWEIDRPGLVTETMAGDAHTSSLVTHKIRGGLLKDDYDLLTRNRDLATCVSMSILDIHFPPTQHDDILHAVQIPPSSLAFLGTPKQFEKWEEYRRRWRDPHFIQEVLDAYKSRCAICSSSILVGSNTVGIEAAHIVWHKDFGPNIVQNGIALCMMHHKLFDKGAFTLQCDDLVVSVSDIATGQGYNELLGQYQGRPMRVIPYEGERPDCKFLEWHHREVFKSPRNIQWR